MSSARGLLGHPAGYTAYCASKSAVDGITRALGCEWGPTGITVNAIAPTVFRSPLTAWMFGDDERAKTTRAGFLARVPKGRLGEPGDLAGPLLFLASAASRLLHRAHPLRRRRLHGGITMAAHAHRDPRRRPHGPRHRAGLRLRGHSVRITDPSPKPRGDPLARCRQSRRCAGRRRVALERIEVVELARGLRSGRGLGDRGGAGKSRTEAAALRGRRALRAQPSDPRVQHFGHPDRPNHGPRAAQGASARDALVESALSRAVSSR